MASHRRRALFWALASFVWVCADGAAAATGRWLDPAPFLVDDTSPSVDHELHIARVSSTPEIDGRLERAAWEGAGWVTHFTQREPDEGQPATQETIVLALYDDWHLYLGFICLDSDPAGIIGEEMRRDARLGGGDYVDIVIDTFRDGRSGFYFATNPLGARQDGRIADEGANFTLAWDCVWDCAAHQDAHGWTAEMAIPFTSLRFPAAEEQIWGINFGRRVRRLEEKTHWFPVPREYSFLRLSLAGRLVGLRDIALRRRVQITPFVSSRRIKDDPEAQPATESDVGLDVSVGLSSNLTADVALNPDFAQVEADLEQINLTRFELWLPEKRPFFLEGIEVFSQNPSPVDLFYTRRIGVHEGALIPIEMGGKVGGKLGAASLGGLYVRTRAAAGQPAAHQAVLRAKRDLFARSSLGILGTFKDPDRGSPNSAVGMDFALKPSDRWEITAYGAGTWTDGRAARATHLGVYWADDRFDLSLDHLDLDEHFDPQLGFVSRVGIRRTQGQVAWTPWVRRWGVRQASFSVEVEHIADPSHRTLERNVHFGNGIRLEREGWSWLTITRTTDVLDAPWSTNAGVVPEGIYRFTTWWLWLRTDEARRVSAALNWEVGGFYGGTLRSIALALNARPVPGLLLELDADRPRIRLPGYPVDASTLFRGRATYAFSPDLFIRALAQRNSDDDVVSLNGLVGYTPPWGHTLYLAYSERREGGITADRALTGKVAYLWRR